MIRRKQSAFDQDKSLRRRLAAILTVVAALLGVCAGAADLLVPITASSWSDGAVAGGPKGRLVRMARNELAGLRDSIASGGTGRLLVNVDDDLELGVVVERTSPTRWGYSLSGRVDSPTVGFVTLVVHEETIAGSIWTPYASYEIVPLGSMGDGVHVMREVAYDVHQCGAPVVEHEVERIASVENDHLDDRNTVVDVLMFTPFVGTRGRPIPNRDFCPLQRQLWAFACWPAFSSVLATVRATSRATRHPPDPPRQSKPVARSPTR